MSSSKKNHQKNVKIVVYVYDSLEEKCLTTDEIRKFLWRCICVEF